MTLRDILVGLWMAKDEIENYDYHFTEKVMWDLCLKSAEADALSGL